MYFRGFDGLRAISVLMVIAGHSGFDDFIFRDDVARWYPIISGGAGVKIFFVLSGFLITTILLNEKEKYGFISLKKFFIRRFLRLMPPLFMLLIVVLILMLAGQLKQEWMGLGFASLYIYNFIPKTHYSGELAHTWSLAVEEHFYLFWAPLAAMLKRIHLPYLLLVLIIGGCILKGIFLSDAELSKKWFPDRWTFIAIVPILIGCFFAFVYKGRFSSIAFLRSNFLPLICLGFFTCSLWLPEKTWNYILDPLQASAVSLFLIWLIKNPENILTNILEFAPLRYIGKISYGIYIWQGFYFRTGPGGPLWVQHVPQNLLLTFATAIVSFELIEKRILKLKEKFR